MRNRIRDPPICLGCYTQFIFSYSTTNIISVFGRRFISGQERLSLSKDLKTMALWILRAFFLLVAIGLGLSLASDAELTGNLRILVFTLFLVGAAIVILTDMVIRNKRIDLISSIYFGLLVGLFLTYIIDLALTPLFENIKSNLNAGTGSEETVAFPPETIKLLAVSFIGISICYLCISILWQTKDDFRFVIPYIEFSKDVKGLKPYVLDTSVVIDGRIADIVDTGIVDNQLVMPRFVLSELQGIADSSDKMRRARGRRGLDILNRLRSNTSVDFKVYDRELPEMEGQPVDMKLLLLARHLDGKVVTGDFNLNKVAKLQNVPVINLNEIANSLKPVFLPGENVNIKIVKQGEGPGQGVGYLDDGTMIVVEDGKDYIGKDVDITVTSMLQTSAGRMVFGKFTKVNG